MSVRGVLEPAVAGTWYPERRVELAALVDGLLEAAEPRDAARAVIAPHAGFAYSGAVAAAALRSVAGPRVRRIVVIGPSHHFGFAGAAIPDRAVAYRTPLGDLPLDTEALGALREDPAFTAEDRFFVPEHALEAELPFLQRLHPDGFALVPVLLGGGASREEAKRVAGRVGALADAATCFVISSDFTHYGARFGYTPFTTRVPERIRELDLGAVAAIEAGDATGFSRYVDATGATICGARAIDVLLLSPVGRDGAKLVAYDTSGRMTGRWDHSVSYAGIVFP